MGPATPHAAETRGLFIQLCNSSVSHAVIDIFPNVGNAWEEETAEFGGRKLGVVELTGPWCAGDLGDNEAVRRDRYWPMLGTYRV